jgi:hypothetical protein
MGTANLALQHKWRWKNNSTANLALQHKWRCKNNKDNTVPT